MKCDPGLGWELIEHDPMLRLELRSIEQHTTNDELIAELMEFFARIDRMIRVSVVLAEEDYKTVRL